jgi:hypothetical protein
MAKPAEEAFARNHVVLKKIEGVDRVSPVSVPESARITIQTIMLR